MLRTVSATRTIEQKVSDWLLVYNAVREEVTPPTLRKILAEMEAVEGIQQFQSYVNLARSVMANDRAAATVAALLTQSGIKTTSVDYGEDV